MIYPAVSKLLACLVVLMLAGCAEPERPIEKATIRPVKLYEVSTAQSGRLRKFPWYGQGIGNR